MLIKGEKYACDACIRGHRVSTCQHHERPLTHINKKGRPVSQCPHCRGLRKARATHVKCECGEKAHNKTECSQVEKIDANDHGDAGSEQPAEQHHCCCTHGARCTCALKKDHLDTVPEIEPPEGSPTTNSEIRKPRLASTQSESTLTVFTNGHHKPVHRYNDMAHKCGAPYTIPRSHTIHGHSEIAQRSMDNLALTKRSIHSHESLPHFDSITSAPQPVRRVKSEHGSPEAAPLTSLDPINTSIAPLDSTSSPFDSGSPTMLPFGYERFHENYFAPQDCEPPLHSAGLNAPSVDWSTFGIHYDNSLAENSQPPSYASFDFSNLGHPGLTASSSGDISEVDEFCPLPIHRQASQDIGELSSVGDTSEDNSYRLSSASSYMILPQASMLASGNLDSLDIDDFLQNADAQTTALEHINTSMSMDSTKAYTSPDIQGNLQQTLDTIAENYSDGSDSSLSLNVAYVNPLVGSPYDPFSAEVETPQTIWTS